MATSVIKEQFSQDRKLYGSTKSMTVNVNKHAYLVYTEGGSNGEYNFFWLCVPNSSGTGVSITTIVKGTVSTVSITTSGLNVTVGCSNTTIIMGYVRID